MTTDSIFFFCISITPFLIIIYSQVHIKKFNNQKHVNFWCALVIRICQQFLTPFMAIPLMLRFSYLIEQIFILKAGKNHEFVFSFIICCIKIFFIDFVINSKADYYDGKHMTTLFIIRIILAVTCFLLSYINNDLVAAIVISLIFSICFSTVYFRLTNLVHVSPIGQYLETVPFFICPFMILFNYFVHNGFYSLLLLFNFRCFLYIK